MSRATPVPARPPTVLLTMSIHVEYRQGRKKCCTVSMPKLNTAQASTTIR